ncbi:MAG TPA: LysR family transcriptional regulator [Rhizomicrobium sp.]|nr:LysR family transcriptional regulator [Rhizomicrobium sp.]
MSEAYFRPQFELRQLCCFVAAAEELHFGRAATRLNMTQPPLSRHIQLLEHALGVKLMDRTSRTVKLTPAGRVFLLEARRILHLTESSTMAVRRMASGEAGTVTLGFTASSGYSFLPRLLLQRAARTPNINMVLREMVGTEQVEGLLTDAIDVGLMRSPVKSGGFMNLKVASESLVAALPVGDPRLAEASLRLADFDGQPLILFAQEGARHFHDLLEKLFTQEGITPVTIQSLSQIHSMLALVRAGMGTAIVPEAAQSLHFDDVYFRPIITTPVDPVELYAVWKTDNENPAMGAFLDLLEPKPPSGLDAE